MLNLSVNLHEKRENIIFVNKRKLFLKCKIQPRLYDFQKAYFETNERIGFKTSIYITGKAIIR